MKKLLLALAAVFIIGLPTVASADTITFNAPATAPNDGTGGPNNFDLDHHRAYTWSIKHTFAAGEKITAAKLTFTGIHNWDRNQNRLFVNMLDFARKTGHNAVDSVRDATVDPTASNGGFHNYFDINGNALANGAEHMQLTTLMNLSMTPTTIVYEFTAEELLKLNEFFSSLDNTLAFGFDPDCHLFNNGISFQMTTSKEPVPEPTTMVLLGTGLAGIYARRRKQQKARSES